MRQEITRLPGKRSPYIKPDIELVEIETQEDLPISTYASFDDEHDVIPI